MYSKYSVPFPHEHAHEHHLPRRAYSLLRPSFHRSGYARATSTQARKLQVSFGILSNAISNTVNMRTRVFVALQRVGRESCHPSRTTSSAGVPDQADSTGTLEIIKLSVKKIIYGRKPPELDEPALALDPPEVAEMEDAQDGMDWRLEEAYRKSVGPLSHPDYSAVQQASTALHGNNPQPSGKLDPLGQYRCASAHS